MDLIDKYITRKLPLISLISAVFIVYPNIACLPWELSFLQGIERTMHMVFFGYRYLFFCILIFIVIRVNLKKIDTLSFQRRFISNLLITFIAYGIYVAISLLFLTKTDCFGSILLFQFFVVCILCTLLGHISLLTFAQRKKEQEIEQLRIENLQSRCDALTNQINPHFFFNSLNGLTSLIRKKNDENTLTYVNKLSDVFRYILQSDKKGLVTLEEELEFIHSFRYMMEVRFANKLEFIIHVPKNKLSYKLPVLSILPLIDNVVVHNMIDSEHKMTVTISLNEQNELMVFNPLYPKLCPNLTNGTGLKNLKNRFMLLMNKQIRIENDGKTYAVYLPLTK